MYCTYVGGNLVIWHSPKKYIVSCLSAEIEYRAMTVTACEMVGFQSFLQDLRHHDPNAYAYVL